MANRLSPIILLVGLVTAVIVGGGFAYVPLVPKEPPTQHNKNFGLQERGEREGPEFEVRRHLGAGGQYGVVGMQMSPDGTMLAYTLEGGGGHGASSYIYSFISPDRWAVLPNTSTSQISWSPDGSMLVYVSPDGGEATQGMIEEGKQVFKQGIWTMNVEDAGARRLTSPSTVARSPSWNPDGSRIAYISDGLWIMDRNGSNKIQLVQPLERGPAGPLAWSADGKTIFFINNFTEIWSVELTE